MSDLNELRDRYWRSVEAFIQGDPEPEKLLWSRRDDVTLTNPFRPPAKGWDRVRERMDSAASLLRDAYNAAGSRSVTLTKRSRLPYA